MNVGDLEPPWVVDITAADTATDFTAVSSWVFAAYTETGNGKVLAFTDPDPEVTPGAQPFRVTLTHAWVQGETGAAGVLHAVPVAIWPNGRRQSFPGASLEIAYYPTEE